MSMTNRTAPDAVSVLLDDGAVVLDMRSKRYYSLNETGACVWNALEDGASDVDAIVRLVRRFDVSDTRAAAAYHRLLGTLRAARLLAQEADGPDA